MDEDKFLEELASHAKAEELIELTRRLIMIPSHWEVPSKESGVVLCTGGVFSGRRSCL